MLCPSECAFPFIAHYVNEKKIKNKDTVTGEIKQETKAINLPRNPACPPVALQLWLVLFLTNRYKDWGKSVTWTLREYSSQKGQKKKKKKAVTNKMMGSEPRPLFSVYFHQTSTNAGFNWWHYKHYQERNKETLDRRHVRFQGNMLEQKQGVRTSRHPLLFLLLLMPPLPPVD